MTSTAAGSNWLSKIRSVKAETPEKVSKPTRSVSILSGRGNNLSVISHKIPRVPMDPTINFEISYPETFFTVLPPIPTISPVGETNRTPMVTSLGLV